MKVIAIGAVTGGGKTSVVSEIEKKLNGVKILHFDDYSFEGEIDDFHKRVMQGLHICRCCKMFCLHRTM